MEIRRYKLHKDQLRELEEFLDECMIPERQARLIDYSRQLINYQVFVEDEEENVYAVDVFLNYERGLLTLAGNSLASGGAMIGLEEILGIKLKTEQIEKDL